MQFVRQGIRVKAEIVDAERSSTELIIYQGVPKLLSGDRVRVSGRITPVSGFRNFGATDPIRQAAREGITQVVRVNSAADVTVVGRASGIYCLRPFETLRYHLREFLIAAEAPGLLRAWLIGDRSGLDQATLDSFRSAGLAHLLAISGQHVGLVALVFFFVFRGLLYMTPKLALWIPLQKIAWLCALFPAALYVVLAGAPVSAVRALILLFVFVVAFLINRTRDLWAALALAAIIILLWDWTALFSISFQLSFVAVGALILCLGKRHGGWRFYFLTLLQATVLVTVLTAPLVSYYFQALPMVGLLANLIAIPLLSFAILPLALLSLLMSFVSVSVAVLLLKLSVYPTAFLEQIVTLLASWDLNLVLHLRPAQVVLCYAALALGFGLSLMLRRLWWQRSLLVLGLLGLFIVGESFVFHHLASKRLQLTMLDVGQGDAMVLSLPDQRHYLIDGGGFYIPSDKRKYPVTDVGQRVVLPYLKRHGIRHLEGIILSHPHPDHYEGLISVVREIPVQNFYWNGDFFPDSAFRELLQLLRARGTKLHRVDAGVVPIEITGEAAYSAEAASAAKAGSLAPTKIKWLNPVRLKSRGLNNRSLVLRIDYGNTCFLLAGDIERAAEQRLAKNDSLQCDVLKAAHHGSKTSSSLSFLNAVQPQHALISVGRRNPFGHPAAQIVERYRTRDIPLWRTDRHGAIRVRSDGENIEVETVVPY